MTSDRENGVSSRAISRNVPLYLLAEFERGREPNKHRPYLPCQVLIVLSHTTSNTRGPCTKSFSRRVPRLKLRSPHQGHQLPFPTAIPTTASLARRRHQLLRSRNYTYRRARAKTCETPTTRAHDEAQREPSHNASPLAHKRQPQYEERSGAVDGRDEEQVQQVCFLSPLVR